MADLVTVVLRVIAGWLADACHRVGETLDGLVARLGPTPEPPPRDPCTKGVRVAPPPNVARRTEPRHVDPEFDAWLRARVAQLKAAELDPVRLLQPGRAHDSRPLAAGPTARWGVKVALAADGGQRGEHWEQHGTNFDGSLAQ